MNNKATTPDTRPSLLTPVYLKTGKSTRWPSDEGFYFQVEGALSLRPVPNVGFRFSLFGDYTNLRFNTPRTEHGLNISVGAGLEFKF